MMKNKKMKYEKTLQKMKFFNKIALIGLLTLKLVSSIIHHHRLLPSSSLLLTLRLKKIM